MTFFWVGVGWCDFSGWVLVGVIFFWVGVVVGTFFWVGVDDVWVGVTFFSGWV